MKKKSIYQAAVSQRLRNTGIEVNEIISKWSLPVILSTVRITFQQLCVTKKKACCHQKTYPLSRQYFCAVWRPSLPTVTVPPVTRWETPTIMPHYLTSQLCIRRTVEGRQVRAIHNVNTCDVWLPE